MSKVKIALFTHDSIGLLEEDMNKFLGESNVKYVGHTVSLTNNPEAVTYNNDNYLGSIAYQLGDSKLIERDKLEKK